MVFLEKWSGFSCDRNLQKVAHFCNSRSRESVWFFLRNGLVFLVIVVCKKCPFSSFHDHEKLYSFILRNGKVFLAIVICRKWPISAFRHHEKLCSFS